jgi:DNA-binding transcriptional ArsR family regulator
MQHALEILAEPRRQAILRLVWDQERCAGEIAAHFEVTRPAISQHLRVLKEGGLVHMRREGTRRLYLAERGRLEPVLSLLLEVQAPEPEVRSAVGWAPEFD